MPTCSLFQLTTFHCHVAYNSIYNFYITCLLLVSRGIICLNLHHDTLVLKEKAVKMAWKNTAKDRIGNQSKTHIKLCIKHNQFWACWNQVVAVVGSHKLSIDQLRVIIFTHRHAQKHTQIKPVTWNVIQKYITYVKWQTVAALVYCMKQNENTYTTILWPLYLAAELAS